MKFIYILAIGILVGNSSQAETVTCTGEASTGVTVKLKIEEYKPLGYGAPTLLNVNTTVGIPGVYLQGYFNFLKRKTTATGLRYRDRDDPRGFDLLVDTTSSPTATLTLDGGTIIEKKFSNLACTILGTLNPPPFVCPQGGKAAWNTELIRAARQGSPETLENLIDCGANADFRDLNGCSSLLYVTEGSCGYHPQVGNSDPSDPLNSPSPELGSRSVIVLGKFISILLDRGVTVDLKDPITGRTALMNLLIRGHESEASDLVAFGADVDAQDKDGMTALMYAAQHDSVSEVRTLLPGNPNRLLKNNEGDTAYAIAKKLAFEDLLSLLQPASRSFTVTGNTDGTCAPAEIKLTLNEAAEIVLKPEKAMFLLKAPAFDMELMASPGETDRRVITPDRTGKFPFTCGVHGSGGSLTKGSFIVQ